MYDYIVCLSGCFVLSVVYVLSLYVWGSKASRNLPSTIKKRFISCFVNMAIAPFFVKFILNSVGCDKSLWHMLGFRFEGLIQASLIPLVLTFILFLGPVFVGYMLNCEEYDESNGSYDLIWVRNHFVGPLCEEFIYRSCLLSMLILKFDATSSIFLSSFFFGTAHSHHIYSTVMEGHNLKSAILIVGFQVLYTTVFGAYSSFLFLRTGHFVAPFLVHAFCNRMGFPNFNEIFILSEPRRSLAGFLYISGLILWVLLLVPATDPKIYSNNLHWMYPHS